MDVPIDQRFLHMVILAPPTPFQMQAVNLNFDTSAMDDAMSF
jgi:hypothetical protein